MAKSILIALLVAPLAQSLIAPRPLTRRSALHAEVAEVDEAAHRRPHLTEAGRCEEGNAGIPADALLLRAGLVYLGPQYKPLNEIFEPVEKTTPLPSHVDVVPTPSAWSSRSRRTYRGKIEVIDVVPDGARRRRSSVGDILRGTTGMALNIQQASEEDFGFSVGLVGGDEAIGLPAETDRKNFDSANANRPDSPLQSKERRARRRSCCRARGRGAPRLFARRASLERSASGSCLFGAAV